MSTYGIVFGAVVVIGVPTLFYVLYRLVMSADRDDGEGR